MKRHIRLRGVTGRVKGQVWESSQRLRIGRHEAAEVRLDDSSVSRQHAEIVPHERGWRLRDVGSTNGSFLNGNRIGKAQFQNLVLKSDPLPCLHLSESGGPWHHGRQRQQGDGQRRPDPWAHAIPPESRPVEDNGRVENAAVPLPDSTLPKLNAVKSKPARRAHRRRG